MSRLIKTLLLAIAGIVVLVVLSAAAVLLFVDPNDFRDDIAAQVEATTGREMQIEGDLSVSVFPWLAIEMGRTRLGNAEGFGDEPFLSFDSARLSVRLLPLLLRREIAVGTAALDRLEVNLAVNAQGGDNWSDLAATESEADATDDAPGSGPTGLDIASVEVSNATLRYLDAQAGSEYRLEALSMTTGRIAFGEPFDLSAGFDFSARPDDLSGKLRIEGRATLSEDFGQLVASDLRIDGELRGIATEPAALSIASERLDADLANSRLQPTEIEITALGVNVKAAVERLSWSGPLTMQATLDVAEFSPRDVMAALDIEPPATADPGALGATSFHTVAALSANELALGELRLALDDTTFEGGITLPLGDAPIRFDLAGDTLNLDRYMAPVDDAAAADPEQPAEDFEIPVDIIRAVNARGSLKLAEGLLSGMRFTNVELGLTAGAGKLRLNPLGADLFDGSYRGDVRIDASGNVPTIAFNERIEGVSLTPLVESMFGRGDITGTIDGQFELGARGRTLSAMRSDLDGRLSLTLADGAWQGVDLWHQLRTARAIYRRETPPAAESPARTRFSEVRASGTVTDGVFTNNDLRVEMPFLQVTGTGTVNLVAGEVDYALQARVLERPEFLDNASQAELDEFTEALIPVRVRGPLTDPSVRPDIEAMFRQEVEDALQKKGDELRDRLLDRLLPGRPKRDDTGDSQTRREQDDAGQVPVA